MHWEKKICIRITLRRVVATLLSASIVINLVIVGAVFGADAAEPASTSTLSPLTAIVTSTPSLPASTAEGTSTSLSTEFPTAPWTDTPGIAPPDTATPTSTSLALPEWPLCIKKFYWPRYRVLYGDTLYSLAPLTRSTVNELISANCLSDSRIYAGQLLYVPRLPAPASSATPSSTDTPTITPTATDTPTPTDTPTDTPTPSSTPTYTSTTTNTPTETPSPTPTPTPTPTDTLSPPPADILTVFEVSVGMTCDPEKFVAFSVSVFDPDGIAWVVVRLYGVDDVFLDEIFLNPGEGTYSGFTSIPDPYTVYDVVYYQFYALDRLGRFAESNIYHERASNCFAPFGLDLSQGAQN